MASFGKRTQRNFLAISTSSDGFLCVVALPSIAHGGGFVYGKCKGNGVKVREALQ